MKIGVDLVFMTGTKGGMETYVREVYARIAEFLPDAHFVGYASHQLAGVGAPVTHEHGWSVESRHATSQGGRVRPSTKSAT